MPILREGRAEQATASAPGAHYDNLLTDAYDFLGQHKVEVAVVAAAVAVLATKGRVGAGSAIVKGAEKDAVVGAKELAADIGGAQEPAFMNFQQQVYKQLPFRGRPADIDRTREPLFSLPPLETIGK